MHVCVCVVTSLEFIVYITLKAKVLFSDNVLVHILFCLPCVCDLLVPPTVRSRSVFMSLWAPTENQIFL